VNALNKYGYSPLDIAKKQGHREAAELLQDAIDNPENYPKPCDIISDATTAAAMAELIEEVTKSYEGFGI
jgi:ankyrin repeat protein